MGENLRRTSASPALPCLILLGIIFPTGLRAQTCTLNAPLPANIIDGTSATTFIPSGRDAEIVVRKKYSESLVIGMFETSTSNLASWKVLSEQPVVISIKPVPPATVKTYEGFSPQDSSVIRFIAPLHNDILWERRTFVVRFCDKAASNDALAIVNARMSPSGWPKVISLASLLILYAGFAMLVSNMRAQRHPLETKYPAFARINQRYGWLKQFDPVLLTSNAFNQGSIQKLQVLLFSFLVGGMVLSLVLTSGFLSDLSPSVALLLGISAVGAAVAQTTNTNRDRLSFENWAWLVQKQVIPINEADPTGPRWSDLVMTNREFDIYKVQTLIFSAVVAVALLVGGEEHLASFAVPNTLLGILGLSQVVYVGGLLARPPTVAELDDGIASLRSMESKLQTAVARGIDTDGEGKLPDPLPAPPTPLPALLERKDKAVNAMRLYSKQADRVGIMLESTWAREVNRTRLDPSI
ncbi:MAG: hypothetical protein ACLPKB_17965 [Xanthobacteraceae bacterium]